jgi:type II secretion system protein L
MRHLGISVSRNRITALLMERTLFESRVVHECTVPCREPFGGPEEASALAGEIRKADGGKNLPSIVLSLPPSFSYLRRIQLPVTDIVRGRKIHLAELEGSLPLEDNEILSDLLPPPPGEPGRFLAVAARRPAVEKTVANFSDAGFRVDRVVTDHVSILAAVVASASLSDGFVVSALSDVVYLHIEGGTIRAARQFPESLLSDPGELVREWEAFLGGHVPQNFRPVVTMGELPPALLDALPARTPFTPPGKAADAHPLAYGAAMTLAVRRGIADFSLRTSAEAESERTRERRWTRIAAAAAAAAFLSALGAIEVAKWSEGRRVALLKTQIRKEFSEAVPGVKTVVQETAQIREKIRSLERQRKELGTDIVPPTALFSTVSRALPAKENFSVREVSYDGGRMRLSGEAGNAPQVEAFRAAIASSLGPETSVTVQESQGSSRGGSVKFTILIEKGRPVRAS